MKKFFNTVLLSAFVLSGSWLTTACSSDDLSEETNPNYNPVTGEVNVDFVFNVSTANEPTTRQSAANTQATLSNTFRGITNAYLGAFKLNNDAKYVTDPSTAADKLHELGPVIGAGKLDPTITEATGDVTKSRRVLQLTLESGTNSLLFYGKAIKDGTDLDQGMITMDIAETPANTSIKMCKIVPETAYEPNSKIYQAVLQQYEKLMAAVLTYIINSGVSSKDISYTHENVTENKTITLNWKDYATVTGSSGSYTLSQPTKDPVDANEDLSILGQRLAYTFVTLNTIHTDELRAGSGHSVANTITDLMANINQVVNATPLNIREVAAQEVAKEIKRRVELFFTFSNESGYTWKSASDVKSAATFVLDTNKELVDDNSNLNNFPADFNLPLGSVILELAIEAANTTGYNYTYNYQGTVQTYAMGGGNNAFDPKNYMYPAELCYFGNSSVRVTNETKVAGDYPDGVSNWELSSEWTGWTNTHVTSMTRAVAMRDNINYGTALLESKFRYGAMTLQDNNHNLQWQWSNHTIDEENNTIDVDERNDHFVITGILVGGQNPEVGWNYLAKGTETGFGAMVYDKAKSTVDNVEVPYLQIPKATTEGGGNSTEAMYTLLWDNWDASLAGNKQRDVYIAVELKNNSKNFFGQNNLIRNGATFYLIGKLDPDKRPSSVTDVNDTQYAAEKSKGVTWPTNYALPPYDADGNTIKQRRVFMQDYMTKATFVIGETSLQHALVSVPDLRSGQISLGLSVDLNWQTGINFGDVILGD